SSRDAIWSAVAESPARSAGLTFSARSRDCARAFRSRIVRSIATYTQPMAMMSMTRMTNRTGQPVLDQSCCGVNDMRASFCVGLLELEHDVQDELRGHRFPTISIGIEAPLPCCLRDGFLKDLRTLLDLDVRGHTLLVDEESDPALLFLEAEGPCRFGDDGLDPRLGLDLAPVDRPHGGAAEPTPEHAADLAPDDTADDAALDATFHATLDPGVFRGRFGRGLHDGLGLGLDDLLGLLLLLLRLRLLLPARGRRRRRRRRGLEESDFRRELFLDLFHDLAPRDDHRGDEAPGEQERGGQGPGAALHAFAVAFSPDRIEHAVRLRSGSRYVSGRSGCNSSRA